jgi:drug/metabolite transporter (DMT)-like permease
MTDRDERHDLALGVGALAVVAWGFGPLIVRAVGVSTPTVVFWRLWLAQPVMIGAAYLTRGRLSWVLLRDSLVPGVLFGLSIMTGFASFKNTSLANATLIGALQPAVLLLLAPSIFGSRSSRRQRVLTAVAFVGIAVLVLAAGANSGARWQGDVYALVNLVIWTAYFIRVKLLRDRGVHAPSLLAAVFLIAACTVTPWALLASDDLMSVSVRGYGWIVVMVLGPGLIGHGSMTWAQRHLDITVASMLTLLSPVLSTMLAWMIYDEQLNALQLVGAAVVVGALAGIMAEFRESAPEPVDQVSVAND